MNHRVWAGALAVLMMGQQAIAQQEQQESIPDAPRPQATLPVIPSVPGRGTGTAAPASLPDQSPTALQPQPPAPAVPTPGTDQPQNATQPAGTPGEAPVEGERAFTLNVNVNFVQVPFTVKDSKGHLVPGLTWHDVHIYENNVQQRMTNFSVDPTPLSVALVIDQSLTFDQMAKVNTALNALQGAFAPYDEVAVFTYNNGPQERTAFTGAQSARLYAVIEQSKTTGREPMMALGGPLSQNININDGAMGHVDPNTNPSHGTSLSTIQNAPREVHTLTDAIYAAAKEVSKAERGRRRIIFVISNGEDFGNQAKPKDVIRYLQTNGIAVYGTLVHSIPNLHVPLTGWVDRIHLPLTMRDNILPLYANQTGGQIDPEFSVRGVATSLAHIAEEARTQYTVGYYTREPLLDGKFRSIEVRVLRPNLTIIAEKGYYPRAQTTRPSTRQLPAH